MTARWVVEEAAPRRDLTLRWHPISLLFKNQPAPDSEYYAGSFASHRMLRVMEAIRERHTGDATFRWYWSCATRVHHDEDSGFDLADQLVSLGFDRDLAEAADDESWDEHVRRGMDQGLALVGEDVGTPIIAFECADGVRRGIFGPVITRVPTGDAAVELWDAMQTLTTMDGFWELKRTRTERPEFGARPDD